MISRATSTVTTATRAIPRSDLLRSRENRRGERDARRGEEPGERRDRAMLSSGDPTASSRIATTRYRGKSIESRAIEPLSESIETPMEARTRVEAERDGRVIDRPPGPLRT
jgi:hypothetical protein